VGDELPSGPEIRCVWVLCPAEPIPNLYERLGKTESKRYKYIDRTLRELWAQWVNFAAAKRVGNEELEASPVNWAFEAAISNIVSIKVLPQLTKRQCQIFVPNVEN
jgi:hypothetical protein